jgi:hypothetical protein
MTSRIIPLGWTGRRRTNAAPTWQRLAAARSEGDGRSRATLSHAQHCEDGEHLTFPAVSTVCERRPKSVEPRVRPVHG